MASFVMAFVHVVSIHCKNNDLFLCCRPPPFPPPPPRLAESSFCSKPPCFQACYFCPACVPRDEVTALRNLDGAIEL